MISVCVGEKHKEFFLSEKLNMNQSFYQLSRDAGEAGRDLEYRPAPQLLSASGGHWPRLLDKVCIVKYIESPH